MRKAVAQGRRVGAAIRGRVAVRHVRGLAELVGAERLEARAASAAGGHGAGVEDRGGVAAVHDLVEALDHGFEETVDAVGTGDLQEGAEDLGGAEVVGCGWEGGGVEVM